MLSWILMKKLIFHNPQQKNLISYLLQLLNIRNFFFCIFWYQFQYCTKKLWTSMQWKCIFAINCWKGKVHIKKHTTFFGFPIFTQQKIAISAFLTIFLRLIGISKNSRQLEEVFFSSLMHQLCRKHQKLTTTNFLLNRSSLTTFFLVIHSEPHFSFIFGAKTSLS